MRRGVPVVKASLNGSPPLTFILDTGSAGVVLRPDVARALNLPPGSRGGARLARSGGGYVSLADRRLRTLALGPARFHDFDVTVPDSPGLFERSGFSGLLGLRLFRDLAIAIDYPNRRLRLSRRPLLPEPGEATLPLTRRHGGQHVSVRGTLGGAPIELLVDTGAAADLLLTRAAAEAAGIASGPVPAPARGLAGDRPGVLYRLSPALAVGPLRVRRPIAQTLASDPLIPGREQGPVRENPPAILGSGLMKHFELIIDQPAARLALQGGPKEAIEPRGPRIVWIPWRTRSTDRGPVVTGEPNPPPAPGYRRPDIRPGDRLLAINEIPLRAWTPEAYRQRLAEPMSVRIALERDGRRRTVVVPIIPLLP